MLHFWLVMCYGCGSLLHLWELLHLRVQQALTYLNAIVLNVFWRKLRLTLSFILFRTIGRLLLHFKNKYEEFNKISKYKYAKQTCSFLSQNIGHKTIICWTSFDLNSHD